MSEFKTTDTGFAAFLVTVGHRVQRIEGSRGRREFIFYGVTDADRRAYINDAPVPARTLFNSYKGLLSTISVMA